MNTVQSKTVYPIELWIEQTAVGEGNQVGKLKWVGISIWKTNSIEI